MKIIGKVFCTLICLSSLQVMSFPSSSAQGYLIYKTGDVAPSQYLDDNHIVHDYHFYHLRSPQEGYKWIHGYDNDYLMISTKTNVIRAIEHRPNMPLGK